jgi:hypothetical protein
MARGHVLAAAAARLGGSRPANQQVGSTNVPKKGKPAKGKAAVPVDPLYQSAQTQARGLYAGQVDANASLQASVPQWYADYQTRAAASAAAQQAYNAPVIASQQAAVQNLNAPAAGLDPSSPEFQRSRQAGQGLSALAQFSVDNSRANEAAGQQYFAGQGANAARELPLVQAQLKQQGGQIATEQAGKGKEIYQALRAAHLAEWSAQQNADIARGTLKLNASNASFDNTLNAGVNPLTGEPIPAKAPTPSEQKTAADLAFFEKHGYYPSTGPPAKPKTTKSGLTPAQQTAKDAKDAAALEKRRTESNKAASRITDVVGRLNPYARRPIRTGEVRKAKDGKTDVPVTRKATPDDVISMLEKDGYSSDEIALARAINAGRKLTLEQVALAHRLGITHVPSEWRPGKIRIRRPANAPGDASGKGQDRPT